MISFCKTKQRNKNNPIKGALSFFVASLFKNHQQRAKLLVCHNLNSKVRRNRL